MHSFIEASENQVVSTLQEDICWVQRYVHMLPKKTPFTILGRSLKSVIPKFSQPKFKDFLYQYNRQIEMTLPSLIPFYFSKILVPSISRQVMLKNDYSNNWYWHLNKEILLKFNKQVDFKLKKGFKLPNLTHLHWQLGLAEGTSGLAWNGAESEGTLFLWTTCKKVSQSKTYNIIVSRSRHNSAKVVQLNSHSKKWYLWLFLKTDQVYECQGKYWVHTTKTNSKTRDMKATLKPKQKE